MSKGPGRLKEQLRSYSTVNPTTPSRPKSSAKRFIVPSMWNVNIASRWCRPLPALPNAVTLCTFGNRGIWGRTKIYPTIETTSCPTAWRDSAARRPVGGLCLRGYLGPPRPRQTHQRVAPRAVLGRPLGWWPPLGLVAAGGTGQQPLSGPALRRCGPLPPVLGANSATSLAIPLSSATCRSLKTLLTAAKG